MENLQNRKKEIIQQIGEDRLKKLKFSKLLKLIIFEIEELMVYWTVRQVNKMVCEVFEINVSEAFFYKFCLQNTEKDKNSKSKKRDKKLDKGVVQEITTNKKKESILDEDELSAIAMFGSSSKSS
ncbi:hypothetical protein [Aliarcobacter butzleri]|uniref:hypothetical protein n=1 Tax=Aliarcobacter butzleri TaxID=28197 RepID=UPI0021B1AB6C|nr:hypothetical protein [Aliarcobacter butzleri]MCT7638468.1 hypothetical protein [Aliarcobacter butzleri]